jgi:hypothetical protein
MRYLRQLRALGAGVALSGLAVPAAASAHPSVYTGTATIDTNPAPDQYAPQDQTRHMVTNHGFTTVLRETNETEVGGVISYALLPGDHPDRGTPAALDVGDSGAQAHATCRDDDALPVPAEPVDELQTDTAILGWQEDDPFYNYVPFQKDSAGLDDDPADWIDHVLSLTGVNLTQVSDVAAACAGLGGTLVPADETQNTIAALASGSVEHATEPLLEEIDQLQTFTQQLQEQKSAAERAAAGAQSQAGQAATLAQENQALRAEVARMRLEATPLRIRPVGNQTAAQLAARGMSVRVTGPAGKRVTVRMLVGQATAMALRLKSRVIGKKTATIGADATALVRITLRARAKAAMRRANRAVKVSLEAVSGDRTASANRRLSR